MYRWAWILFCTGILCPAPGFLYSGFWGNLSGLSAVGYAVEWSRALPDPIDARHGLLAFVLALGFFSNLVFWATRSLGEEEVSRGWRLLLLGALAVNASLAFLFPPLMKIPGYWLWLAAWAAVAWAFVEVRGTSGAPASAADAGVPAVIWVWLAFFAFWMGVTVVNRVAPLPAEPVVDAPNAAALTGYVDDPGHLLLAGEKERFEQILAAFERETSCQIAVALYPRVPEGAVDEFTLKTAERSRLGRKGLDNGAILFVFAKERVARLEVGYGLEGALPDITASHILREELAPRLAKGEVASGLDASLSAILATIGGEYGAARSPSFFAVARRKVVVAAKRVGREGWPTLRKTDAGARVGISLFAGLLGMGVADGLASSGRLALALSLRLRGRPAGAEMAKVHLDSIWDTIKLFVFLVIVLGGVVVVAGGGGFGGAGALARW